VAPLWKMICNLGDPMSLRHPVLLDGQGRRYNDFVFLATVCVKVDRDEWLRARAPVHRSSINRQPSSPQLYLTWSFTPTSNLVCCTWLAMLVTSRFMRNFPYLLRYLSRGPPSRARHVCGMKNSSGNAPSGWALYDSLAGDRRPFNWPGGRTFRINPWILPPPNHPPPPHTTKGLTLTKYSPYPPLQDWSLTTTQHHHPPPPPLTCIQVTVYSTPHKWHTDQKHRQRLYSPKNSPHVKYCNLWKYSHALEKLHSALRDLHNVHSSSSCQADFLKIRSTWDLDARTLEEAALCFDTKSFFLPVVSKIRPAVPFSLQKFGCGVVVFRDLKPGSHEMSPGFDYLTHGAAVDYSRGCPGKYWKLPSTRPSCLYQEIACVISCRLIYIIMSFKPFNDIIIILVCKFPIGLCRLRSYPT